MNEIAFYDLSGKKLNRLDFGIVRLGESRELIFTARNTTKALLLDLKFSFNSPEISILEVPNKLEKFGEGRMRVRYAPVFQSEDGFSCTVTWEADKLTGEVV